MERAERRRYEHQNTHRTFEEQVDRRADLRFSDTQSSQAVCPREFTLDVFDRGSCEALKAGVHATTLGLAVVMGLYNAAAWVRRREQHLAVNTVLYAALTEWEREQVAHHLAQRRQPRDQCHEQPRDAPTREPCQSGAVAE